jgi:hypothetical protein
MFLTALVAKLSAVLLTGWAADRGMAICWSGVVNSLGGVALQFATAAVVNRTVASGGAGLVGVWVMQVILLGWTGWALALIPPVGINIFTPDIRVSGYNLGYALASGFVGGLTPLAVTAIRSSAGAGSVVRDYGAPFWTLAAGGVSALAYVATLLAFPACNHAAARPLAAAPAARRGGPRRGQV